MSATNSNLAFTFITLSGRTCHSTRSQALGLNPNGLFTISKAISRRSVNTGGTAIYKSRDFSIHCANLPGGGPLDPSSVPSPPGGWYAWILGFLMTVIIPFTKNKWGPLLQFKDKVEDVVQKVEDLTEAVEQVAQKVEDMAEDVAEKLPAGKLKEAANFIEKAADRIGDDARIADEVIDKLQEMDEEMETFIKHVSDEANEIAKESNEIAKKANEVAKGANEVAKEANELKKQAS